MKSTLLLLAATNFITATLNGTTINEPAKYAWGTNVGWTNWRPSDTTGVVIGEFICSGYIYGANVGWIHLGSGFPINQIQYQNTGGDYGVNYTVDPQQPGYAVLRGFAYGANIGWVQFETSGNPRLRFTDGALEGYAYGANVGWINLGDPSQHFLRTDHIVMGLDSDGDGIADAFEYQFFGSLAPTNQTDSDGDGVNDLNEYLQGTHPLRANEYLRVTAFSTNATGTNSPITWTSTTARLYTIETSLDLSPLSWVTDTTFSYPIAPDPGSSTSRTLLAATAQKRFYRVRSITPLP
ncbi:MAG TPA: hypothetical protein VJ719_06285 [Chthoniobacterales bacterium]|nr:hypothetical protein [Chthoniobacterales bacterium]